MPVEGWFVDKYGPRIVVLFGGILCAIGWAINAHATSLSRLLSRRGHRRASAPARVYGTCVGNALKWFPGPARPCRRHHRRRLRRRLGADRRADRGR